MNDDNFPHAIVEINNPENLILFHKVVIPSSLGDETQTPPYIGKYCNVLMVYEANGHSYLYSSDGVPTAISFTGGGILVVSEFPEVEQAAVDSLYIKSDTGDAVITHDNQTWITINEPGGKVRLVEEFPSEADARKETLYILSKNGEARILDIDGTWLPLNTGGGGSSTVYFNNIINRPKIDGVEMTSNTDIPLSQIRSDINSLSSTLSSKLNKYVITDLNADTNPSTTEVKLQASRENLWDEHQETKTIPLPVAGPHQAGVINTATYNTILQNTEDIEAIMGGAVAINNLPDPVTQQEITDAWKNATGQTDLINHASVYDVTNNKVWTYYANEDTWYPASNTAQVNIDRFTNTSEGTIKGSLVEGRVFAETDGTGSVNGWDTLSAQVSDNTDSISDIQTAVDGKQDKLTAGNAITIEEDGTTSAWIYPERFFLDPDVKEGEGDVFSIDGTAHLKVSDIKLYGKTSQSQYKGTNLLNSPFLGEIVGNRPWSQDAYCMVVDNDRTNMPLNGATQKYFLYKRGVSDYDMPTISPGKYITDKRRRFIFPPCARFVVKTGSTEYYSSYENNWTLDVPSSITPDEIYYEFTPDQSGIPVNQYAPCIIPAAEFPPAEPFVGLQDSPSPNYPQRIMTVTGEQEIRAAGSNLYNYQDTNTVSPGVTTDNNGYITFSYNNALGYKNYYTNNLGLKPSTQYTIVVEILSVNNPNGFSNVRATSSNQDSQTDTNIILQPADLIAGKTYVYRFTTKPSFDTSTHGLRTYTYVNAAQTCSVTMRLSVVEDLSMTPAKFKYQPYVGQTSKLNLGKNIFDKNNATYNFNQYIAGGNVITNATNDRAMILYYPCDPYTEYAFSDQSSVGLSLRRITFADELPSAGVVTSKYFSKNAIPVATAVAPTHAKYIVIEYRALTGETLNGKIQNIIDTLQIERSQAPTSYSQYFEPIELCKLGSAQDTISKDGLNWILHKEIAKLTYDGTETDWTFDATNNSVSIPHNGYIVPGDHLCTHFRVGDATSTNNTFSIDATSITFKSNEVITSLQAWKDWLAENNLEVYAKLATPTDTQITQPEVLTGLVGARNAITYPDQTNFSVGAQEDIPAYLWIEAYLNSLEGITKAIRDIPICC